MSIVLYEEPLGQARISAGAVRDIVNEALRSVDGVKKLKKMKISLHNERMIVNLLIICKEGVFKKNVIEETQNSVNIQIKKWLGIAVSRVNVTI